MWFVFFGGEGAGGIVGGISSGFLAPIRSSSTNRTDSKSDTGVTHTPTYICNVFLRGRRLKQMFIFEGYGYLSLVLQCINNPLIN